MPQEMGMLALIGGCLPRLGHVEAFLSFVVGESHEVFFVHADSSLMRLLQGGIGIHRQLLKTNVIEY